jgi:hypothetical protein
MEERNEIDEILLRQPEMLKHNLPVKDLGTTLPPKEDPVFDLKPLPDDLKYAYIDDKKTYPIIISSKLLGKEEERLLGVLRKHRGAIGYTLDDLKGISPIICQHAINMEPDAKPVVGYRMCIDFRKVNKVTKKDHYPLPFIDQMLERLSKKTHFCFLDGYSEFSQIAVKKQDQEKPLLLVLMELMLIDVCLLVCLMLLLRFKDACMLSFMVFVKKLWKYSWTISLSMELLLVTVCTILIKFCRAVRKLILFLIGRNATLWLMKELFLDIKFLKEVLKLTEQKLKQLRKCPVLGMSKVFVVFLVMLVSIGGLLRIYLKFQSLLLIFFKNMFLLFLIMIVRKLSKFLRRL